MFGITAAVVSRNREIMDKAWAKNSTALKEKSCCLCKVQFSIISFLYRGNLEGHYPTYHSCNSYVQTINKRLNIKEICGSVLGN